MSLFDLINIYSLTLESIQEYIKQGVDINAKNKDGYTILMKVIDFGFDIEIVKFLIDNGADVNAKDNKGLTALMISVDKSEDFDITSLLIENGADVNAKDNKGLTALIRAFDLEYSDYDTIEYLINKGADIEVEDENGYPFISIAFEKGYEELLYDLFKKDEKYSRKFFDSFTDITINKPFISSTRCKAFTLGYGNFEKDKSIQGFKLPCCWSTKTDYTRFVGKFVKIFNWDISIKNKEYEISGFIKAYYNNLEDYIDTLFLKNYPLFDSWKDFLNEKYKDLVTENPNGEWCMFPGGCPYCT